MELMMRNILLRVVVSICAIFFADGYASQVIDVCIEVDKNKSIPVNSVPEGDSSNYTFFGLGSPSQSDSYYQVKYATYQGEYLENTQSFARIHNLVKKAPKILLDSGKEKKDCLFPKYIPSSFLEKVKAQENKLSHIIEIEKDKKVTFNYTVKYVMPAEKTTQVSRKDDPKFWSFTRLMPILLVLLAMKSGRSGSQYDGLAARLFLFPDLSLT
jgi:hypothetical protein